MEGFTLYSFKSVEKLIALRKGEVKFGEKVQFLDDLGALATSKAKYVLFGIPEDIGVRANYGKDGASKAWEATLAALLNIQANLYTRPENLILLGEISCDGFMQKASNLDTQDPNYHMKMGELVSQLDDIVSLVVQKIIAAGKVPIIIGGGHNNAYGNIKGAFNALEKPINVLNIDAHTDLRTADYRHSGNGFSFARKDKILGKYRVFGVHQNYTPQYIFDEMKKSASDSFRLFEHLILMSSEKIKKAFLEELEMVSHDEFGLELDCDAIKDFSSSAQSPTGLPINMVRNFIWLASEEEKIKYLHICEASANSTNAVQVGKSISYLITDFITAESYG